MLDSEDATIEAATTTTSSGVTVSVTPPTTAVVEPKYEFDEGFQEKIAALAVRDTVFMSRVEGLIYPEHFENDSERFLVKLGNDFYARYKKAPDTKTAVQLLADAFKTTRGLTPAIKDEIKSKFRRLLVTDVSDRDFVVDKIGEFARHKAVEKALVDSIGALDKRDHAKIQELMDAAMQIGVVDEGIEYDYFEEIENRTQERIDLAAGVIKPDGITTGHGELDLILTPHGGWGRKELSCLLGGAKAGKSMALADFGLSASMAGYRVLYLSCEVSAKILGMRLDANVADIAIKLLKDNPFKVRDEVQKAYKKALKGYKIREYATGTLTPTMLRKVLERYRAQGLIFDLVIVDYADIMKSNTFHKEERDNLREIYIDLRAIAFDYNCAMLTATQSNREGMKAMITKATDVAEDINKVRTIDVLISINSTEDERSKGEARLFFAAMRNAEDGFTMQIKQDRSKMKFIRSVIGRL